MDTLSRIQQTHQQRGYECDELMSHLTTTSMQEEGGEYHHSSTHKRNDFTRNTAPNITSQQTFQQELGGENLCNSSCKYRNCCCRTAGLEKVSTAEDTKSDYSRRIADNGHCNDRGREEKEEQALRMYDQQGEHKRKWNATQCLRTPRKVRRLMCKTMGPQYTCHIHTDKLRKRVMEETTRLRRVHRNPIQDTYVEESICQYTDEPYKKVYVLHGLSLYCPMDFLSLRSYGLVDTGAGANLINSATVRKIIESNGSHAMAILKVRKKRLVVKVANDKTWVLNEVATVEFKVRGHTFEDEFWVTPEMQEDVLLGIPALRKMSADLSLAKVAKDGADYLYLRDTRTRVPLSYYPTGISSNPMPLTPISKLVIPAGTAKLVNLQLRPGIGMVLERNDDITGIVSTRTNPMKSAVVVTSINSIEENRSTTVLLRNTTGEELVYWPGDEVAQFDPVTVHTARDEEGNDLLFMGADGKLHKKITYTSPTQMGEYTCGNASIPLSPVPVAKIRVSWTNREIINDLVELNVRQIHEYAQKNHLLTEHGNQVDQVQNSIDGRISLPKPSKAYSWRDVKVNPKLSPEEKEKVSAFLQRHEEFFEPITQSYPNKLLPDFATQVIKLKEGTVPFRSKAYPLSKVKQEKMKEIIDDQLSKGMISPSQSPFTSPAFLVPKPGGKWRLVIDFRKLNQTVEKSSWPIPKMADILNQLAGSTYLSSLDLVDGFHQCALHADSKQYTAFVTSTGVFEYNTTPMGLATSPNHFQFVMDSILRGSGKGQQQEDLIGKECFLYIDDLLVFSKGSLDDHLKTLDTVISRLAQFGLKAKATKVAVAMHELKFLGYMVGKQGKWPDPSKTEAIDRIPIPKGRKSKTQLMAFLGMCSFYRGFIDPATWARTTGPLYDLVNIRGRSIDNGWTPKHTELFQELKQKFKEAPILAHPHFDKPFLLKTDCSKTHAGAILSQEIDGKERVIEYASTKLTKPQRRWHMTHLEGWAVVWALTKWSQYLDGRTDTTILVDHKALLFLRHNQYSDASGKLTRWFTYIDTFQPKFVHRAGKDHADCDALTRMYEGDPDIIWDQQDPTADWIFDVLDRYLNSKTKVQMIDFKGPIGSAEFNNKHDTTLVQPQCLRDYPRALGDVVVGVPPSTRQLIAPMFSDLKESGARWAVWCPLRVLQASYFTEPDVQLIVVQGPLGYGCTRRAEPERGAWITHGLGLKKNEFLKSSKTAEGPKFVTRTAVQVRGIKRDWEEWRQECVDHDEDILPDVQSKTQARKILEQIEHNDHFAEHADRIVNALRKHATNVDKDASQYVQHVHMTRMLQNPKADSTHRILYETTLTPLIPAALRAYLGITNMGPADHVKIRGIRTDDMEEEMEDTPQKWTLQPVVEEMIKRRQAQRETAKDLYISYNKKKHKMELDLLRRKLDAEDKKMFTASLKTASGTDRTTRSIKHYQDKDVECQALKDILTTEKDKTAWKTTLSGGPQQKFILKDGVIWVENKQDKSVRLFVPCAMRKHIVYIAHKNKMLQHPGIEQLTETLKRSFWWPRMTDDVRDVVQGCISCARSKPGRPRDQGPAIAVIPEAPFTVVGADLAGPFPPSTIHKYRYILTFVDHYSRWIKLVPLVEATATAVAEALLKYWVRDYGVPDLLVSDKGSQFTAEVMTETANYLGIKLHTFPAESQWRNGKVERVHRYIKERLKLWKKKDIRNWPELLPFIEMAHHFMVMPQYGMSSYEILFGHPARLPFTQKDWTDSGLPSSATWIIGSTHQRLQEVQARFNEIEEQQILKRLAALNKARSKVRFEPGQQVLFYTKGTKDKLTCLWSDVAVIDRQINANTFLVRTPDNSTMEISSQRLRPFHASSMENWEKLGPLTTDYPHILGSSEQESLTNPEADGLLEKTMVSKKPPVRTRKPRYRYVNEEGKEPVRDNSISLTYGQYVAYSTAVEGGWMIAQYLGEHPHTPSDSVTLRKMNIYKKDVLKPRACVWHYEWQAKKGRNVMSSLEKGLEKLPYSKGTGGLSPFWIDIKKDKLICTVSLTQQGKLTAASYREICSNTETLWAISSISLPLHYYS